MIERGGDAQYVGAALHLVRRFGHTLPGAVAVQCRASARGQTQKSQLLGVVEPHLVHGGQRMVNHGAINMIAEG